MHDDQQQQKEIAFYSALVHGWLTTRLEHDKSKLTISAAAIGLLVTLLSAFGVSSVTVYAMYVVAFVSFFIVITCVITIFKENAKHLEKVVSNNENRSSRLNFLDKLSNYMFIVGVIFTLGIGLVAGFESLKRNEVKAMSDQDERNREIGVNTGTLKKSWDGISNMKPSQQENGSSSTQQADQQQQSQADKK